MSDIAIRRADDHRPATTTGGTMWVFFKGVRARWNCARAAAALRRLDDRALADIGLERSQIAAAVRGRLSSSIS